jgi:hypothetical protein
LPRGNGDGLRVRGVILAAFPAWHDELGCNQPRCVTPCGKPPTPVMGRTTRLHGYIAGRQLFCPSLERVASKHTPFYRCTMHIQYAYRNDILCEIDANRSKLFHDFPSCSD